MALFFYASNVISLRMVLRQLGVTQRNEARKTYAAPEGPLGTTFAALTVIIDPDDMAGRGEGVPGDVEPAVAGEELVGELPGFEEID